MLGIERDTVAKIGGLITEVSLEKAHRFVEEELPDLLPRAGDIFRHKGAYARFKDMLESKGALQRWYQYEADATKAALLRWCAEHGVEVEDI